MNAKTHSINPVATGIQRKPFRLILITGLVSVSSLFALHTSNINNSHVAALEVSAYTPSVYGVESLELTSPTTGKAAIKLDDLTVNVSFVLGSEPSDYGVHGSEYNEVYVKQLFIGPIVNESGTELTDFTTANDHFNINQLIIRHMYKNKLVEGV